MLHTEAQFRDTVYFSLVLTVVGMLAHVVTQLRRQLEKDNKLVGLECSSGSVIKYYFAAQLATFVEFIELTISRTFPHGQESPREDHPSVPLIIYQNYYNPYTPINIIRLNHYPRLGPCY